MQQMAQVFALPAAVAAPVRDAAPRYDERHFPDEAKRGKLCAIVSGDGRDGSLPIYQDAALYATILAPGESVTHPLAPGRRAYVHVVRGAVTVNGKALAGGDAAKLEGEGEATLSGEGEALLFDLP